LSFHSLRRTATTLLHEAGVPSAVAQALIGHDSEAMHGIYISVGREALEKATAASPEICTLARRTSVGSEWILA
jgi:integrase